MAFEDLQKAFIEADLAKLNPARTDVGKVLSKVKKGLDKKTTLTKLTKKAKGRAKVKTPKELEAAKKNAKLKKDKSDAYDLSQSKVEEPEKKQQKTPDVELSVSDKAKIAGEVAALKWAEIPDATRVAQPEANVPTILDQKEVINKTMPNPQDFAAERTAALVASMKAHSGGASASGSIAASKTPITEEVRAAKASASKEAGSSMDALLASHSNK